MLSPPASLANRVLNQIPALVAYWDLNQRCRYSNAACQEWFGKNLEGMVGMTLQDLLGPMYEKDLGYIFLAIDGKKQFVERQISSPDGEVKEAITTYTPDVVNGIVRGFTMHVADVTILRERETTLEKVIRERDEALAEVRVLRGILAICSGCKHIRDAAGEWRPVEEYVSQRTEAIFSHGLCPECVKVFFPGVDLSVKG